jgi:hypothetical protein
MRAKRVGLVGLGLVVLVLVAGCGDRGGPPDDGGVVRDTVAVDPSGEGAVPEARPAEQRMSIPIEGMDEELRVLLYESPADFPLGFSTYVPEDMVVERWPSNEGDAVAFVAAFGGYRNEAAAMRVIAHRPGATEHEVEEILSQLARDLGADLVESSDDPRHDWSVREFRSVPRSSRRDAPYGTLAVGRQDGRYYTVAIHYPPEYGDGFAPRTHLILEEWRWRP